MNNSRLVYSVTKSRFSNPIQPLFLWKSVKNAKHYIWYTLTNFADIGWHNICKPHHRWQSCWRDHFQAEVAKVVDRCLPRFVEMLDDVHVCGKRWRRILSALFCSLKKWYQFCNLKLFGCSVVNPAVPGSNPELCDCYFRIDIVYLSLYCVNRLREIFNSGKIWGTYWICPSIRLEQIFTSQLPSRGLLSELKAMKKHE